MRILLTNDDGIFAPGLAALRRELSKLGDVTVVAPATEQSGVGHSITFLMPLVYREVYDGDLFVGYAVEGSPADCVKLAVAELCSEPPQLVVSGINGGLNAGINVLYSGTVAAAIEGAFFQIDSVAVSLEYDDHARFDAAAVVARHVIEQIPAPQDADTATLQSQTSPRRRSTAGVNSEWSRWAWPDTVANSWSAAIRREDDISGPPATRPPPVTGPRRTSLHLPTDSSR